MLKSLVLFVRLPKAFFEKYWFLTIDYTLRRTTNRWRRLQGLNDLENDLTKEGCPSTGDGNISGKAYHDDKDGRNTVRQQDDRSGRKRERERGLSWGFTNH
jgi:hypothetical protein